AAPASIDRVVEPERKLDFARTHREMARLIELAKTGVEVRQRVVVAADAAPGAPHTPIVTFVRCDANLPAGAAPAFKIDERTHAAHRHPRGHSPARLPPGCLPGKALLLHVAEQQTRGEKEQ